MRISDSDFDRLVRTVKDLHRVNDGARPVMAHLPIYRGDDQWSLLLIPTKQLVDLEIEAEEYTA
jgi:hypothetical protein